MLEFHDIQQNEPEWFALRAGKLTGSKLACVMANYGKAFGEPAKKYAVNIAIEQITGDPISDSFSNEHMQRGHEQEPFARVLYESETFSHVDNGGFFCSDIIGCSPDGLVGDNGIIEIKSVIPSAHFATLKRQNLDPAYKWQCIGTLKHLERDWIDFVSYCEGFPPGKQLFVYRLKKEDCKEDFQKIDLRVAEFMALVEQTKSTILNSDYFI